jgi:hypothetical protein
VRKLFRDLEALGGLASWRELAALGNDRWSIEIPAMYGKLLRVRHGWFARPDEDPDVLRAWRVGGRLACVSAMAWHAGAPRPATLHVEVPANAARLRSPDDPRRRLGPEDRVVVHWARRRDSGGRRAVGVRDAWAAAARCGPGPQATASESASRIV